MKAMILDAKLKRVNQIWKKHKPQGIGFSDTDIVIVNLKTENGKEFTKNFYCRLKADGTIGHSITKASEKRQQDLQNFIKKYISHNKKYDLMENIHTWKGKKVDMEEVKGEYVIKV